MENVFTRFLDKVEIVEKALIALFSVTMIVTISYQVVMRYWFDSANAWSEELARYLLMYVVMFGATIALRKNGHLHVDFFINSLSPKNKFIMSIFCTSAGIVFLLYFFVTSIQLVRATANSISAGLNIPMSYVYAAIPIGSVLMILASIEIILKQIAEFKSNREVADK